MDLNYSAEEIAFRDEVRAWIRENLPDHVRDKVLNYREFSKGDLLGWHRKLAKKGWVAPFWPKEWGGTEWTVVQRYIFEEECGAAGCPPIVAFGVRMCAPVLLRFGTDEQKQRYLPGLCDGSLIGAHGMSEPGSGSDAFSLSTSAVEDGEGWRLNGSKTFTTNGPVADVFVVFATTDKAKRFAGLCAFLVDRDMGWKSEFIQTMGEGGPASLPLFLLESGKAMRPQDHSA